MSTCEPDGIAKARIESLCQKLKARATVVPNSMMTEYPEGVVGGSFFCPFLKLLALVVDVVICEEIYSAVFPRKHPVLERSLASGPLQVLTPPDRSREAERKDQAPHAEGR
jgi:hypothetical protein